jgi:hypothetical protein
MVPMAPYALLLPVLLLSPEASNTVEGERLKFMERYGVVLQRLEPPPTWPRQPKRLCSGCCWSKTDATSIDTIHGWYSGPVRRAYSNPLRLRLLLAILDEDPIHALKITAHQMALREVAGTNQYSLIHSLRIYLWNILG